ncbi:SulP family inorganic anion transporter [Nocardia sp. 348MFTsu5.1]|uniref:SulP family inorganic anion transporter n=1 Tax=Nocardia sp. 348MFTsu5.1 TaxID=1172185 RepID=UPI001E60E94E|nr:SulP family inorganic anion transporter [Nocardia sp. 348MFTsu5.1]
MAGVPGAIGSVPDGMAAGVLAGVGPVQGLYASVAGRVFGGFSTSSRLMVVTTTSASALAAGSALADMPAQDRSAALVVLTLIAGVMMVVAGILRLGRYTRFVSHSVMTGFLVGVSANIICGQLPALTGMDVDAGRAVEKAFDVVTNPGDIDIPSLIVGVMALVLMVVLGGTRLKLFAAVTALTLPWLLAWVCSWNSVPTVSDEGAIPSGLPVPGLPDFTVLTPNLVAGALAVMVIVLVQGAGVAETTPNPDGSRAGANQDFAAQGLGNIGAGLLNGMPVGASVGQTALNQTVGARTRWAAIFSGLWLLVILVALSGLVGKVLMPTLAAVLIVSAAGAVNFTRVHAIWSSGFISRTALLVTFVATLFFPVTIAVAVGVALSLLLQLNQEAMDLRVIGLAVDGEHLVETKAPDHLRDHGVVILDIYGSLFYAGARTLQAKLPDPATARSPVVVLRLRGRTSVSATFFAVIADYADRLEQVGGRLYLSGVDPHVRDQWTDKLLAHQGIKLEFFPATAVLGESTLAAYAEARVWLHSHDED